MRRTSKNAIPVRSEQPELTLVEDAFTSTSTRTTTVAITNQLSVPVDIYDQFDPGTEGQTQPIQYTRLATVAAGATANVTTIHTVSLLVAAITGPIAELNGNYYYQLPIKAMSGTQVTFGTPAPLAYTIDDSDRAAAVLSFNFHKFAMANPGSALTKNFNAALKTGFSAVNTFFQSTANFKTCTMASWHIVMTWLENVTSGWQGPYFLYEAPPSPAPANYVPQLVATLSIQSDANNNSAVLTACSADDSGNPVYSKPAQQTTLVLHGDGTMQEANPGTDVPVLLTPIWMNVIQTPVENGTPTTKYLIGNNVTGTVGGTQVVSSQTARQVPGKPAKPSNEQNKWDKLFAKGAEIIGALAGLIAVYDFVSKKFGKGEGQKEANKQEAASEEDLEEKNSSVDEKIQAEANDPKGGVPELETSTLLNADAHAVVDGYADTVKQMKTDTMTDVIEQKVGEVEQQVEIDIENGVTPTDEFETAFENVQDQASEAMEKIQEGDFDSWTADFQQRLDALTTESANATAETAEKVADLQESYEEGAKATESLETASHEHETETQNEETDSGYDDDDVNDPPETDEMPPIEEA